MFGGTDVRILMTSAENASNVTARKPGLANSVSRKPLLDRAVNEVTAPKSSVKPKVNLKSNKVEKLCEISDLGKYVCSYKEPEDTFEDIMSLEERKKFLESFSNTRKFHTKTPPPKITFEIEPMVLEIPSKSLFEKEECSTLFEPIEIDDTEILPISLDDFDL